LQGGSARAETRQQNPNYSRHDASGRARVYHKGEEHYHPDPYGSPESLGAYSRFIAGLANPNPPRVAPGPSPAVLSIAELIERFWSHAKVDYRCSNGTPTGEADVCEAALRPVLRLFGKTLVAQFTPQSRKPGRAEVVRIGLVPDPRQRLGPPGAAMPGATRGNRWPACRDRPGAGSSRASAP
jgi:hypothetical protein